MTTSGLGPDLELSEHGPWFVGGTVRLVDLSFTIKTTFVSRETLDAGRH